MRASLFLILFGLIFGYILWATLSGALLLFGLILFFIWIVMAVGYSDTAILFFLGARYVRSGDEKEFSEAAAQEAYKLSVDVPDLYFYNGSLERGFVLQNRNTTSLVLSRSLIQNSQPEELSAVCFELLLQVKKGMARKRTKVMFIIGFFSWILHGIVSIISSLIPVPEVNRALGWIVTFFLHPCLEIIFKMTLGNSYFKRLEGHLSQYPRENEALYRVGLRLRKPAEIYSLPSRKLMEFSSMAKSRHFQNIQVLELLPHEWDFFFIRQDLSRA